MNSVTNNVRRFFSDKHGKIVIGQAPNPPILVWFVLTIVTHLVHRGRVQQVTHIGATIALAVWAVLEVKSGASPFRRVLGTVVLVFMVIQLLRR